MTKTTMALATTTMAADDGATGYDKDDDGDGNHDNEGDNNDDGDDDGGGRR